ncbi:MAG TPA: FcoT family thioesterase [Alphaproteobacteria bacterium]|nr:FcoT family thioesterase [Alphaproteobacteria bacterium]
MTEIGLSETIDTMLKEYPSNLRFLRKAEYIEPNGLRCKLYSDPNWAYSSTNGENSPVNHFTASESCFSHNQMAYVLLAYMAQYGKLKGVEVQSLDNMNNKKFNDMMIAEYTIRFSKPFISSQEFSGEFYVQDQNLRRTKSGLLLFVDNEFSFENGKAYGKSKGVIKLNETEIFKG